MPHATDTRLTRREILKVGSAAAAAGYCLAADPVLAQAIKTDTQGIQASDASVKIGGYDMPVYCAQPASGGPAPVQDDPNPVTGFDVVKDIKAPFLGLFGETDQNPSPADARRFGEMLKAAGNPNVEIVVYPGAGHAFHADYRPSYNAAAAADAWKRCVGWFDKYLKA